jgi:hypothetical protein
MTASFDPPTELDNLSDPVDWPDDFGFGVHALRPGVLHTMDTTDAGYLECCGTRAAAIPAGDSMVSDPQRVTCGGIEDAS